MLMIPVRRIEIQFSATEAILDSPQKISVAAAHEKTVHRMRQSVRVCAPDLGTRLRVHLHGAAFMTHEAS